MAKSEGSKGELNLTENVVEVSSPKGMMDFAKTLKKFIADEKLFTVISSKAYVHVEGWQFVYGAMGIVPIIKSVDRIETDDPKEVKYKAFVELKRVSNGEIVGAGVAFCSNKESKKRSFEEYAVASMAQTRAISKAGRLGFGWLMKVAGYEATPAEEMEEDMASGGKPAATEEPADMNKVDSARESIKKAKTFDDMSSIMASLNPEEKQLVMEAANDRMREITEEKEHAE